MKTLNMFYLIIYCTQKLHNDFIFLCNIVLPPVDYSWNHQYHCWNLQDNRAVVRMFIALSIVWEYITMHGPVNVEFTERLIVYEKKYLGPRWREWHAYGDECI